MLKKINEGCVKSDAGFSIQIINPDYLEYCQDEYCVYVSVDYNPKIRKIFVYASKIDKWFKPKGSITISKDEKEKIIINISRALKLLKGNFEVI